MIRSLRKSLKLLHIGLKNVEPDPTIGMERVNFTLNKPSVPTMAPPIGFELPIEETDDTISLAETDISVATTVALDTQIRKIINLDDKKEKKKSKKKSKNEPKVGEFGSKEIRAVPAIVPKPTKEVFGKDLRDKVKRLESVFFVLLIYLKN